MLTSLTAVLQQGLNDPTAFLPHCWGIKKEWQYSHCGVLRRNGGILGSRGKGQI